MSIQFQYYDTVAHGYTGILTLAGGMLITDGSGVPSFSTTLTSPTLGGTVTLPGVGATTWSSAGLNAHQFVWNGITDGAGGQPLWDIYDTSMDPAAGSTGVAMRFFGRQQNLANIEGGVMNVGLKVTTTNATKGDFDFIAYNWNGTTLSIGAHVSLDGQTAAFEPAANNTYDLGTGGQGWRDFYLARAMYLNASAGTAGQVPVSAGAGAAVTWGTLTTANLSDYAEGTWTPADFSNGLSLTVTDARYVRIGKLCTVSFNITYPVTADTTVNLIGGLPFTAYNGTNSVGGGGLSYTNYGTALSVLIGSNATTFQFYLLVGTAPTNASLSAKNFRAALVYRIA